MPKRNSSPDMVRPFTVGGILFIIAVLLANTRMLEQLSSVVHESNEYVSTNLIDLKATVVVDAKEGWQTTNIFVEKGASITIKVVDGKWTEWNGERPYNAGVGSDYVCAHFMQAERCLEPVPDYPSGALVGKIGSQILHIGKELRFMAQQPGTLSLRINDVDSGLYDNDGMLTIEIEIE